MLDRADAGTSPELDGERLDFGGDFSISVFHQGDVGLERLQIQFRVCNFLNRVTDLLQLRVDNFLLSEQASERFFDFLGLLAEGIGRRLRGLLAVCQAGFHSCPFYLEPDALDD